MAKFNSGSNFWNDRSHFKFVKSFLKLNPFLEHAYVPTHFLEYRTQEINISKREQKSLFARLIYLNPPKHLPQSACANVYRSISPPESSPLHPEVNGRDNAVVSRRCLAVRHAAARRARTVPASPRGVSWYRAVTNRGPARCVSWLWSACSRRGRIRVKVPAARRSRRRPVHWPGRGGGSLQLHQCEEATQTGMYGISGSGWVQVWWESRTGDVLFWTGFLFY